MKKPSEWTANEAWAQSAAVHLGANKITPFPTDPVERVSDETVRQYAACALDSTAKALAVEVLASRSKDKQVERSDPTIVYDEEELTPGPKKRKS